MNYIKYIEYLKSIEYMKSMEQNRIDLSKMNK